MAIICLVITSCSKEDAVQDETVKYEIDLGLAQKNDGQMSQRILELINIHRDSLGLNALQMDNSYASAYAVEHTQHMIELEKINHDNFGYRSEAIKYHDKAQTVGENVAYGYDTAEKVVNAWLNSPGHREIMEGNYTHTGFGVMTCDKGRLYYTQLFYRK